MYNANANGNTVPYVVLKENKKLHSAKRKNNATKKTSMMKGKSTKSCQAAILTHTDTKGKFSIAYM
jgi:hypothetical protein